ncbi:MITF [Bugula neritina]|uniref:MITF n=1 Tax=Bugula neritina TaxID=10212 RepID=A0A7J7JDG4_BUGNE|nr:MITF [Bugula neritina]
MNESGIEIDIGSLMADDDFPAYDGQLGELKSSSFVDRTLRTEVKHASTPLKIDLKMQLQKQQLEDQLQRSNRNASTPAFSQSTAINMPITVSALSSPIPHKVVEVKTGLLHPTKYYLQQTRNSQIQSYLSESLKNGNRMGPHSMPAAQHTDQMNGSPYATSRAAHNSSSMPDATSPLSVISSSVASGGSPSEVDEILGDILGLEQADAAKDQDLNMILQLSSTVPHNMESGSADLTQSKVSLSAPVYNDLTAWSKDRQKKDNHNQIERRRRYNINDRIKELGTLLPSTSDPDFRQNKGTILKASVDYIRDLKRDQQRLKLLEEQMKEKDRQNRLIMLRLQLHPYTVQLVTPLYCTASYTPILYS